VNALLNWNVVIVNMGRKKVDYSEQVVPVSFGAKRKIVDAFDKKLERLGFDRSEVLSTYMETFIKTF